MAIAPPFPRAALFKPAPFPFAPMTAPESRFPFPPPIAAPPGLKPTRFAGDHPRRPTAWLSSARDEGVPGRGGDHDGHDASDLAAPAHRLGHASGREANLRGSVVDPRDPHQAPRWPRRRRAFAPGHGRPNRA